MVCFNNPLDAMTWNHRIILYLLATKLALEASGFCHEEDTKGRIIEAMAAFFNMKGIAIFLSVDDVKSKVALRSIFSCGPRTVKIKFDWSRTIDESAVALVTTPQKMQVLFNSFIKNSQNVKSKETLVILHEDEAMNITTTPRIYDKIFFAHLPTRTVYELYEVNEVLIRRDLAKLKKDATMGAVINQGFLERRNDFHGQHFRMLVDEQTPYLALDYRQLDTEHLIISDSGDEYYKVTKYHGVFPDLLYIMKTELNISFTSYHRKDRQWGWRNASGHWHGMIGSLINGEGDMIASSLTLQPIRAEGVDYFVPLGMETYALFLPTTSQAEELDWRVFYQPFTTSLWRLLLINALGLCCGLFIFQKLTNRPDGEEEQNKPIWIHLLDTVSYYWTAFCSFFGLCFLKLNTRKTSLRLLLFTTFFFGNIIFMSYRASLTSGLSVRRHKTAFDSLEDLMSLDYKLTIRSGGTREAMFVDAAPDSIYGQLYDKFISPQRETAVCHSLQECLEWLFTDAKRVFFYYPETIFALDSIKCEVDMPWTTAFPGFLSMAVAKGNPHYELFQHFFLRQKEKGVLDRLHIKWIKEKPNCASDASVSLGLEKLVGLFALLFIGFISSIWACSMECLWKYLGPQGRTRFLDPQRWTLRDQMRFKKDLRRSLDNLKWSPSDTDLDAILHIINSERTKRSSVLGR